ncbi:hypothetical protein WK99_18565 [Burkholderia ubonensis]|nr:hypothetical protein WK99_18565 [Burkholderia ubonensis]
MAECENTTPPTIGGVVFRRSTALAMHERRAGSMTEVDRAGAALRDRHDVARANAGGCLRAIAGFIGVGDPRLRGLQRLRVMDVGRFRLVPGLLELDQFRANLRASATAGSIGRTRQTTRTGQWLRPRRR